MGLNCSHNAFDGAYSAFNRLRQFVCKSLGEEASFAPHWVYGPGGTLITEPGSAFAKRIEGYNDDFFYHPDHITDEANPGLMLFLKHSDYDGEISPEDCVKVADELEALLPAMEALGWIAGGHIERAGGYVPAVKKFIAGCRLAAAENEPLKFH